MIGACSSNWAFFLPKSTHPIDLTAEEVKSFQRLIRTHTTPQAVAVRVRIILRANAHSEENNQQIAQAVGSGAPRRFSPQVRAQVAAIACSLPKQCQVPLARWSRAELARRVTQDPTLETMPSRCSMKLGIIVTAPGICLQDSLLQVNNLLPTL